MVHLLIITLAIGGVGAFIGLKLKIPAGSMIGAMAAVVVFNLVSGQAYMTAEARKITQIAAGALIGSRITRADIYGIRKVALPAIVIVLGMIVLNFSFGFLINRLTALDLPTALFATAPGGMSDMSLIADELGADSPKVAILQLLRIIVVISIYPFALKYICSFALKRVNKENCNVLFHETEDIHITDIKEAEVEKGDSAAAEKVHGSKGINLLLTLCVAALGGTVGILIRLPAGAMVASMISVVAFSLVTGRGYFPRNLRIITQTVAGSLIGSRMTWEDIYGLKDIMVPAVIMVAGMMLLTILIAYTIYKFCRLDLPTALLASTPGGLQEMSMIAEDFGADTAKVTVLQLLRLLTVISVFPSLLKFVYTYFS